MYRKFFVGISILVLLLSACSQNSDQPQSSDESNEIAAEDASDQSQPIDENTEFDQPPDPTPAEQGSESPAQVSATLITIGDPIPGGQPWRLVDADNAFWLVSEFGDQIIPVELPLILQEYQSLKLKVSPSGDYVAIHAATQVSDSVLFIWDLTGGKLELITPLFTGCSPDLSREICEDMWRATGGIAWSNQGDQLAFTGALMETSSDLYLYDLDSGEISELTDGPAQAVNPTWTPDDAYILHAAVDRLYYGYSGSGYEGWQFYSSEPDGSKNHTLAAGSIEGIGDEEYLGWAAVHKMLLHSGYWFCGYFDLRMMDAVIDEEHIFWHGNYHGAAYSPDLGFALVFVDPAANEIDECGPIDQEPGLYLVTIPGNKQTLLDVIPSSLYGYEMVSREGIGVIFVRSLEGWIAVSADGRISDFSGNPYLPQEYWELELEIDEIFGWVAAGGL